jgi:FkbM family methyltransferase
VTRSIYLDFGANAGDTLADHIAANDVDLSWGFEPNPMLAGALRSRFAEERVEIIEMAAWTENGVLPLFLGNHPLSSTLLPGKVPLENFPQFVITYDRSVEVQTLDTAAWLREHVLADDFVIAKMDIEGAEYPVLRRLLDTGTIDLIDELRCEFHPERFPAHARDHDRLVCEVERRTRLVKWE